jgi:hypothetical protein
MVAPTVADRHPKYRTTFRILSRDILSGCSSTLLLCLCLGHGRGFRGSLFLESSLPSLPHFLFLLLVDGLVFFVSSQKFLPFLLLVFGLKVQKHFRHGIAFVRQRIKDHFQVGFGG